jgi:hypothetical protein
MNALRLAVIAILAVLAAGCATTGPMDPIIQIEVREVKVPVPVRCIDPAKVPPKSNTAMDPKGDVKQKAAGAAIDIDQLKLEVSKLRVLVEPCLLPQR